MLMICMELMTPTSRVYANDMHVINDAGIKSIC